MAHHILHNTEKSLRITIRNENIPTPPKDILSFIPCSLVQ